MNKKLNKFIILSPEDGKNKYILKDLPYDIILKIASYCDDASLHSLYYIFYFTMNREFKNLLYLRKNIILLIKYGCLDVLKKIYNETNINMEYAIKFICHYNRIETFKYFVDRMGFRSVSFLLETTVIKNNTEMFKYLIKKGYKIKSPKERSYLIEKAAYNGNIDIIKILCESNAKVDITLNALMISLCNKNNFNIFQYLFDRSQDIYKKTKCLQSAVTYKNLPGLKYIYNKGYNFNEIDFKDEMETIIENAVHTEDREIIDFVYNNINFICPENIMDKALIIYDINLINYLIEKKLIGCSNYAINHLCASGKLDILKILDNIMNVKYDNIQYQMRLNMDILILLNI